MEEKVIKLKQLLKEELGIYEDVKILSDFFVNYIKDKKYGIYTLIKNNLPIFKRIDINKIIIDYNDKNESSYFDVKNSQITSQGAILYFSIVNRDLEEDIHHEVNHAIQFFILGKEKSEKVIDYIIASGITERAIKKNEKVINYFSELMSNSYEPELNAAVAGTYGKLKHKLLDKGWEKGMIENNKEFRTWFTENIKNTNSYEISIKMINYNIFEEFNKRLKGVTEYQKKVYFTIFKNLLGYKEKKYTNNPRMKTKVVILSEEQVNSLMKNYQNFINKQGEKLRRKLFRLYDLFL